jgi:hypothetical protein
VFGGFAVNFYGFNRYTADLDLWIDPVADNLKNLKTAILELGFNEETAFKDFIEEKSIMLRLAEGIYKVDLLQKINLRKSFMDCHQNAVFSESIFGKVYFLSYDDLIDEKIRSKRPKDLLDIEQLKTIRKDWNTGNS